MSALIIAQGWGAGLGIPITVSIPQFPSVANLPGVPQLARSFGMFFTASEIKGKKYFGAKIIPARGVWIEIESDALDYYLQAYDDRNDVNDGKQPADWNSWVQFLVGKYG